ncbi:hypothetical protein X975_08777, partial [Stegodyphus mimosarum]
MVQLFSGYILQTHKAFFTSFFGISRLLTLYNTTELFSCASRTSS